MGARLYLLFLKDCTCIKINDQWYYVILLRPLVNLFYIETFTGHYKVVIVLFSCIAVSFLKIVFGSVNNISFVASCKLRFLK